MDKKPKQVFVTVGTTSFDELIETVSQHDILEVEHAIKICKIGFGDKIFRS